MFTQQAAPANHLRTGMSAGRPGPRLGLGLECGWAGSWLGQVRCASSQSTNKQPPPAPATTTDPEPKVSAGSAESSAQGADKILASGEFLREVGFRDLGLQVWSQHQQHLHSPELVRSVGSQALPQAGRLGMPL